MSKLIYNGSNVGGTANNASAINCTDAEGNVSTVQAELDKVNGNLGGMKLGFDESGTPGYYDSEGNFKTFVNTSIPPVDIFTIPQNIERTLIVEEDSCNYTIACYFSTTKCKLNGNEIPLSACGSVDGSWAFFVSESFACKKGDVITISHTNGAYMPVAISKTNPFIEVFTLTNTSREFVIEHDSKHLLIATSIYGNQVTLNGESLPLSVYGPVDNRWGFTAIKGIACKKGDVLKITTDTYYSPGFLVSY